MNKSSTVLRIYELNSALLLMKQLDSLYSCLSLHYRQLTPLYHYFLARILTWIQPINHVQTSPFPIRVCMAVWLNPMEGICDWHHSLTQNGVTVLRIAAHCLFLWSLFFPSVGGPVPGCHPCFFSISIVLLHQKCCINEIIQFVTRGTGFLFTCNCLNIHPMCWLWPVSTL